MKITEADRARMQAEMEAQAAGMWLKLVSEIQYFGDEVAFFVLVDGPQQIEPAYRIIKPILDRHMPACDETKFNLSFSQKQDGFQLIWNALEDDELRSGVLRWPLAHEAEYFALQPRDVFGSNAS